MINLKNLDFHSKKSIRLLLKPIFFSTYLLSGITIVLGNFFKYSSKNGVLQIYLNYTSDFVQSTFFHDLILVA